MSGPRLQPNPQHLAGCYMLHLYCRYDSERHVYGEFPHEYTRELGTECRARAKRAGWKFHRDGAATCPKCAKDGAP